MESKKKIETTDKEMPRGKIGDKHDCLKCGHSWHQRAIETPEQCPKCRNYRFWEPRKEKKKKDGKRT